MGKKIYKEPKRKPKPIKGRPRGPRGWLAELIDPEGKDANAGRRTPGEMRISRQHDARRAARRALVSKRKMAQWERLEWVTDKIVLNWSHRKIVLEFAKKYGLSKDRAMKYIARVYKDFQKQYTDPTKRNTLLAGQAATLKQGMRQALEINDLTAFNALARQYGEIMGILTPAHLLKFHLEDNRQQVMVGSIDEAKATLKALESLSEQDLFSKRTEEKIIEAEVVEQGNN